MEDEDVGNKKGIYDYVLTGNERSLNLRLFSDKIKRQTEADQSGRHESQQRRNRKRTCRNEVQRHIRRHIPALQRISPC